MRPFLIFLLLIGMIGCAHPVSRELRQDIDETLTFDRLLETPEEYIGKRVMFGGAIVETRALPEGTEIEVVQKKIDFTGYPEAGDESGGRFIFFNKGFLEPEIYSKGRGVTGVGKLTGTRMGKVGERPYEFPVIEVEELKLLDDIERNPYFYPPYWDPWYRPHSYAPYWPFYQ
ncbi:MAG: starvation-inducible protein [Nitrospinae bacterium]|nr:starvation-inducible protein [Nitrospinota bacterium]MZH04438.1 starvation-inducible protein [Nitrospinota bacterium]MZH14766.1 starvation-inducible protein [Nitrospinota bacterium]